MYMAWINTAVCIVVGGLMCAMRWYFRGIVPFLDVQCAFWYRQRRVDIEEDIEEDIEDCVSRESICNRYYNERECNKYKIQTL